MEDLKAKCSQGWAVVGGRGSALLRPRSTNRVYRQGKIMTVSEGARW